MPQLRVSEKEHWVKRIQKHIGDCRDNLLLDNPALVELLKDQSVIKSKTKLGLNKPLARVGVIENEIQALEKEKHKLEETMAERVEKKGYVKPVEKPRHGRYCYGGPSTQDKIDFAIEHVAGQIFKRLLEADPIGKHIAKLDAEKEAAIDAVWIATSPDTLVTLWKTVENVAKIEPSKLVKTAKKSRKAAPKS